MRRLVAVLAAVAAVSSEAAHAADQTHPGAGNARAVEIARSSPLVNGAFRATLDRARQIGAAALRSATLDALFKEATCIRHRAGLTDGDKSASSRS